MSESISSCFAPIELDINQIEQPFDFVKILPPLESSRILRKSDPWTTVSREIIFHGIKGVIEAKTDPGRTLWHPNARIERPAGRSKLPSLILVLRFGAHSKSEAEFLSRHCAFLDIEDRMYTLRCGGHPRLNTYQCDDVLRGYYTEFTDQFMKNEKGKLTNVPLPYKASILRSIGFQMGTINLNGQPYNVDHYINGSYCYIPTAQTINSKSN
jgi:hypothetical protein